MYWRNYVSRFRTSVPFADCEHVVFIKRFHTIYEVYLLVSGTGNHFYSDRYAISSWTSGGEEREKVEIAFLHYHSKKEALRAWNSRKQRINWDNVFVICCDEGLTYEDMKEYDALPYEHKILFVSKLQPEIDCAVYCRQFPDKTDARLLNFANPFGKRNYQKYIDYVTWLNM